MSDRESAGVDAEPAQARGAATAETRPERRWGTKTGGERRAERRERLMATAVALYGRDGFRNVSVKAICTAAGLTERYFYESFENGEDLLRQCFAKLNREMIERLRAAAAPKDGSVVERLRAALRVYLKSLRMDPAAARLFLVELVNVSAASEAVFLRSLDDFASLLLDVLGPMAPDAPAVSPLLLHGVIGGGLHIARAWLAGGCIEDIEQVADAYLLLYTPLLKPTRTGPH